MEGNDISKNGIIQVLYNKENKSNGNLVVNSLSDNDNNDLARSSSNYVHYNDKQYFLPQREKDKFLEHTVLPKEKEKNNSQHCFILLINKKIFSN